MDILVALNLLFCIIIVIFGYWGYQKNKNPLPLYIAISFGLFGVSHFFTLLGYSKGVMETLLIVIRSLAYILVIYALYSYARG